MTEEQKKDKMQEFVSNIFLDVVKIEYQLNDIKKKNSDLLSQNIDDLRKKLADTREASDDLTDEQKADKDLMTQYALQINEYQNNIDLHVAVTDKVEKLTALLQDSRNLYTEMVTNAEHYINLI